MMGSLCSEGTTVNSAGRHTCIAHAEQRLGSSGWLGCRWKEGTFGQDFRCSDDADYGGETAPENCNPGGPLYHHLGALEQAFLET